MFSASPSTAATTPAKGTYAGAISTNSANVFHPTGQFGQYRASQVVGFDVLLFDPVAARRDSISRTIVEAGGTARVLEKSVLERVGDWPSRCRIALVALGNPCASPVLELIARLKTSGSEVVAYEENVQQWPIAAKCLPLLAGTAQVLDSGSARFAKHLRYLLEKALQAQTAKQTDDAAAQSVMREQGIVGESPAMLEVFCKAIRFGSLSDVPVFITGETGTGKELLARAIHRLDPKHKHGPFVPVNCAAINPGLLESEFFGHRRGAFTGAEYCRKGLIRAAEGGVLFLDEIGELDLGLQAKLLRVLQENSVLTVGDERETRVEVRFIGATNRDLRRMVDDRKFRADLFHRLRGLVVRIPPVRERRSDLSLLIEHSVPKHHKMKAEPPPKVSADFVEAFRQLYLPGNVREVENLVCEALANHHGEGDLGLNDLPVDMLRELTEAENTPLSNDGASRAGGLPHPSRAEENGEFVELNLDSVGWNFSRAMSECERQVLMAAMQHALGNQSETARLLGITARTVNRKLHGYHVRV